MRGLSRFKVITIAVSIISILSTSILVLGKDNTQNDKRETVEITRKADETKKEDKIKVITNEDIPQLIGEHEETYEEWEKRMESGSNSLSREKVLELYNQGYDFYDIQVAEELSGLCDKDPIELLELKGKTIYITDEDGIKESGRSWSDIMSDLQIKLTKPSEAVGLTDKEIDEFKNEGLSDEDIEEAVILAFNYKKTYDEILKEIKKGKSLKDLKKYYWEERKEESKKATVSSAEANNNTEKILKKQYNITEDEIEKCKKSGIESIVDIAMAKDISGKKKVTLEQVLEWKKSGKSWTEVLKEAEVIKHAE